MQGKALPPRFDKPAEEDSDSGIDSPPPSGGARNRQTPSSDDDEDYDGDDDGLQMLGHSPPLRLRVVEVVAETVHPCQARRLGAYRLNRRTA